MSIILSILFKINNLRNTYLPAGSLRARFAKGAFWSLAGAVISRGLNLVSSIIVARLLGKVSYGELGIIQSTVGMLGVFAGLGLGITLTKYVAEFREKDPEKTGRIIALLLLVSFISGLIVSIILIILSQWIAEKILSAPHLSSLLKLSAFLLFFGAINGAQTGALSGFEAFKTIAIVSLISGIISFPLMVEGVFFFQLKGAVLALVASMVVNYFLNRIAIKRECERYKIKPDFHNSFQEIPVLWRFSVPAFLSNAMVGPVSWLCNTILVNQPNGYAEMGIFNAANQWYNAMLFLPGVMSQVVLPLLSQSIGIQDSTGSAKVLNFSVKTNGIIIFTIAIICSIMSPLIMGFYGEGFRSSWPTLIVVLITASLLAIQVPVGNIIVASGKMWWGLLMNMGWGVVFIFLTWNFVRYGALGLAGARLGAYIIHAIWTFGFAYFFIKQR